MTTDLVLQMRLSTLNIERVRSLSRAGATASEIATALNWQTATVHAILGGRISPVGVSGLWQTHAATMQGFTPVMIDAFEPELDTPEPCYVAVTDLHAAFRNHKLHSFVETSTLTLDALARRVIHGTEKPKKNLVAKSLRVR